MCFCKFNLNLSEFLGQVIALFILMFTMCYFYLFAFKIFRFLYAYFLDFIFWYSCWLLCWRALLQNDFLERSWTKASPSLKNDRKSETPPGRFIQGFLAHKQRGRSTNVKPERPKALWFKFYLTRFFAKKFVKKCLALWIGIFFGKSKADF